MPSLTLPAPAKLNLFLHIVGRRDDDYHLLQTAFQFLDYSDELTLSPRADGFIECLPALPGVPPKSNLIFRAAALLKSHTRTPLGADIRLTKRLPMGGGIGGGSSDAATTLLGLNHLWQTQLGIEELAELGLRLGADVPVFVRGHASWAEGVGEKLTPLLSLPEPWFVVLTPPVTVPTVDIFRAPELTRDTPAITVSAFLAQGGRNDCESVVRKRYPEVDLALRWLARSGEARMTGTGACVFQPCATQEEALARMSGAPCQGFVARGCNRSPAIVALESGGLG